MLCDRCHTSLSNTLSMQCAICVNVQLCMDCFSSGVKIGDHESNHPYRLVDLGSQPVFDEEWTADEEILLLDGIARYGMGNWNDVANHIGSKTKTKLKVEQHYNAVFLKSKRAPLPVCI